MGPSISSSVKLENYLLNVLQVTDHIRREQNRINPSTTCQI